MGQITNKSKNEKKNKKIDIKENKKIDKKENKKIGIKENKKIDIKEKNVQPSNIIESYGACYLDNIFTVFTSVKDDIIYLIYTNKDNSIISYNLINLKLFGIIPKNRILEIFVRDKLQITIKKYNEYKYKLLNK